MISIKLKNILLLIIGLIIVNYIGSNFFYRIDLTKDKRFTLSDISINEINKINDKILINVYLEGDFPSEFKRLQTETRQFLEEFQFANQNFVINFINPDHIREKLIKKGMIPSQLSVEENDKLSNSIIFPWAEIIYKNKSEILSLLSNSTNTSQEEQLENAIASLEFSFISAIKSISNNKKKKIAILSGNGELQDIYLHSFLSEVKKKYNIAKFTLDSVATNPQKTLKELTKYDLAIIAKPTIRFTDKQKLTLDQFIVNGGKSIWMIDNIQADTDSLYNYGKMLAYPRDLNLTDLLFNYGVRINNKLIEDVYCAKLKLASGNIGNQPQFENFSWFYHPLTGNNPKNSITKNILPVRMRFATEIDTLKQKKIKKTPLLVSSPLTKKIGIPTFIDLNNIAIPKKKEYFSNGIQLFAVLLEGEFSSAYKNRIRPFKFSKYKSAGNYNKMIVIADGDIAKNQILKGKPFNLSVDKWTNERFGNKDFLLNSVDYLLDDSGLINLRNKAIKINLLDKNKTYKEKLYWQTLNIIIPIVFLILFYLCFNFIRKKIYI